MVPLVHIISVVAVSLFDAMYPSKEYTQKLNQFNDFAAKYSPFGYKSFWISDVNYRLFIGDKNINVYEAFFQKNY